MRTDRKLSAVAALAAAACIVAAPVRAEMPNYNTEAYCARIAAVGGAPSQSMKGACFGQEQTAYDGLKEKWETLPATMKSYCDRIARVGGDGSFSMLSACVRQEQGAAKSNGQFQFKR